MKRRFNRYWLVGVYGLSIAITFVGAYFALTDNPFPPYFRLALGVDAIALIAVSLAVYWPLIGPRGRQ